MLIIYKGGCSFRVICGMGWHNHRGRRQSSQIRTRSRRAKTYGIRIKIIVSESDLIMSSIWLLSPVTIMIPNMELFGRALHDSDSYQWNWQGIQQGTVKMNFTHRIYNNTEDDEGYDIHNITEIYKQLEGHGIWERVMVDCISSLGMDQWWCRELIN